MDDALQLRRFHSRDAPDKSDILGAALAIVDRRQLFRAKNVPSGKSLRLSAEFADRFDQSRIHLAVEHLLDDAHGSLIGDAQAVDEPGGQSGLAHLGTDGLATAMDKDRIDPDRFEKDHIAQKPLHRVVALHRAAAVFDDEGLAAEFLYVGQRLDQRRRTQAGIGQAHAIRPS